MADADRLPGPLKAVVEELARLPGLGPKSALRVGLTLLKWPRERSTDLGRKILELREKLCLCERCAGLSEASPCELCNDARRDAAQLCLVTEWDSVLVLEESGQYRGYYMVLGGLLSPLDGVQPGSLEFARLRARLAEGQVRELILALGSTLDAETTASYVKNLLACEFPAVSLTRLAQGIPLGSEVKYIDKETLKQSLMYRQCL